jgi:hypothetical protein
MKRASSTDARHVCVAVLRRAVDVRLAPYQRPFSRLPGDYLGEVEEVHVFSEIHLATARWSEPRACRARRQN